MIGCTTCPCASTCPSKSAGLSGGGCPANGRRPQTLGLLLPSIDSIDLTDSKTWIIGALLFLLVYQLFFTTDKRQQRGRRRAAIRQARERYASDLRKIREAA